MRSVAIIEDQTAIRELVCKAALDPKQFKVILESGDGLEGCEQILKLRPDFVILDVLLPQLNGPEIIRRIVEKIPNIRILVFSGHQSPSLVSDLLRAGAHGFVEKSASLNELKKGIEITASGGSYFGPEVADMLREVMADPKSKDSGLSSLTKRERQVLQLIAESHSTRSIAEKLAISVKTAENHRTNLMRKLNLHDVASLTRFSMHNGLISPN
jgi:DNA-binding NarL/FixJ family response regulator